MVLVGGLLGALRQGPLGVGEARHGATGKKRRFGSDFPFMLGIDWPLLPQIQGDNFGLLHGWVDFDLGVPPCSPGALPVLPDNQLFKQTVQQPKQNQPQ